MQIGKKAFCKNKPNVRVAELQLVITCMVQGTTRPACERTARNAIDCGKQSGEIVGAFVIGDSTG